MRSNLKTIYRTVLPMILLVGLLSSCNDKEDPVNGLSVSDETVVFPQSGGTKTVLVNSDQDWTYEAPQNSWFTVEQNGNKLTVTATVNDTDQERTDQITVKSNAYSDKVVKIVQNGSSKLTFRWKDAPEQTVTIAMGGDWSFDISDKSWLSAEKSGEQLVIKAADNRTGSVRNNTITITSGKETFEYAVEQRDRSQIRLTQKETSGINIRRLSQNGRYVIGGTSPNGSFLWDRETDEFISFGNQATPYCVTNDGVVGGTPSNSPAYYKDGQWHEVDLSAANLQSGQSGHGAIRATTPDGSIMGGMLQNSGADGTKVRIYTPIVWLDGPDRASSALENPIVDLLGETPAQGGSILSISEDGKVFMGEHVSRTNGYQSVFSLWTPEHRWPGKDHMEIVEINGTKHISKYHYPGSLSPDGKWACGVIMSERERVHFKYNLETDEMIHSHQAYDSEMNCTSGSILNDGTMFFFLPTNPGYDYQDTYVWKDNNIMPFDDWMKLEHNVELGIDNIAVNYSSGDGKILAGGIKVGNLPNAYQGLIIEILD